MLRTPWEEAARSSGPEPKPWKLCLPTLWVCTPQPAQSVINKPTQSPIVGALLTSWLLILYPQHTLVAGERSAAPVRCLPADSGVPPHAALTARLCAWARCSHLQLPTAGLVAFFHQSQPWFSRSAANNWLSAPAQKHHNICDAPWPPKMP